MTWRHFLPLIGFALPTAAIGYGVVIPRSCIAGVNELTIGFAITIVAACATYALGLRQAVRGAPDRKSPTDRGRHRQTTQP